MSEVRISAEPRTDFGKGGARRTRRAGKVPAVVYGHGEKPRHISLPGLEFAAAIRKGGANQLISIEVTDGTRELVIPKDIQRDPLRDDIVHADLLIVRKGETVTADIPINFVGEAEKGGLVVHELTSLNVETEATHIPESIEVSIEGLAIGSQRYVREIEAPEGIVILTDGDQVLASVSEPRGEETDEEGAEDEAAAE
ncbi:50S ribosomal protein L25/general stress protein Ctc [Glycomyces sp. TRM65418]|uniref:50S ribosomal protein L25/general stress protein Ctc n=1 Tax=Glycomyces sp. TRM65418 TaxID=2867006 RepID=UPI001CE51B7E|nr:50S ribosomal protein L25/general stress protein Ctc [Glycomyces sp. TRM65418]MCC3765003.1 50S ribosomal protein L25/general stress protein Ctc [Glycomyces sp. TRM65418]QZD54633.1 50S ribosomal protein L25/general stress protein Ctc [Glycomyces sp. TRM65418]